MLEDGVILKTSVAIRDSSCMDEIENMKGKLVGLIKEKMTAVVTMSMDEGSI